MVGQSRGRATWGRYDRCSCSGACLRPVDYREARGEGRRLATWQCACGSSERRAAAHASGWSVMRVLCHRCQAQGAARRVSGERDEN